MFPALAPEPLASLEKGCSVWLLHSQPCVSPSQFFLHKVDRCQRGGLSSKLRASSVSGPVRGEVASVVISEYSLTTNTMYIHVLFNYLHRPVAHRIAFCSRGRADDDFWQDG